MIQTHSIQDGFFSGAKAMRREFERRFENPHRGSADRFVWDYWNVEGQYSLMRTPAARFFTQKLIRSFYERLLTFGRERLGCAGISPPWLSYYVDGCYQDFHADVPHGPWAYVFSLTPWQERQFQGGETLLLRPEVLDYWRTFTTGKGVERDEILQRIPAEFNRLTVFDPRIPHGVARVSGVRDPLQARLVVHGWFTEPQPFIEGALTRAQFKRGFAQFDARLRELTRELDEVHGTLCLRFKVRADGGMTPPQVLTENIRAMSGDAETRNQLLEAVQEVLASVKFPRSKGVTRVTLPLLLR